MKFHTIFSKKSYILTTLFIAIAPSWCITEPIHKWNDIDGLTSLSKAFLSQPEFVGNFQINPNDKPSPRQAGIDAPVLKQAIKQFKQRNKTKCAHYLQKVNMEPASTICFMGDIHGSIHSLIRNLWRLVHLGYLNENLTLRAQNFYMIFLGDYINRGRWSAEVLTTLLALKLKNWDHVFLLAGNHETNNLGNKYGLREELERKFSQQTGTNLCTMIQHDFFQQLPIGLFINCNGSTIQCCHGGIEPSFNPKIFLRDHQKTLLYMHHKKAFEGLVWSDFCYGNKGIAHKRAWKGVGADQKFTQNYLHHNNLCAIFRGHQDRKFGLKTFANLDDLSASMQQALKNNQCMPFHWERTMQHEYQNNIIPLPTFDYYPVFTLSTATEGKELPYDCFCLAKTGNTWHDWTLEVHEHVLKENRYGCYLQIQLEKNIKKSKDCLKLSWHKKYHSTKLDYQLKKLAHKK